MKPRALAALVLLAVACDSDPYGDILNGKPCSPAGECAPGYQCIEGTCATTWLVLSDDDGAPPGQGGDGAEPSAGGSPGAGGGTGTVGDCVARGNCPPTLELGASCSATNQCISGFCVDNVCCESACAGPNEVCDGTGACVCTNCNLPPGAVCAGDAECATGKCSDQDAICCDSDCNGTCVSCKGIENGMSDGQCGPILFATDPAAECQGNDKCDGDGGCVECHGNDCDGDD